MDHIRGARLIGRWLFAAIALLALLAGASVWLANEPPPPTPSASPANVDPAALYAATFRDRAGLPQPLGRYQGKVLVLNFWATWCAPCREEMPAFARLRSRWAARNVEFVGLANDDPAKVERFARGLGITFPLLTGGAEVDELARRLGDAQGLLPFTVVLDPGGAVLMQKVGAYTEAALESELARRIGPHAPNDRQTSSNGS
jgi:thiol-disulfide isomerase/thioredoxin